LVQGVSTDQETAAKFPGDNIRALLESLTGPSRGRVTWLSSERPLICVDDGRMLLVRSDMDAGSGSDATARAQLRWSGDTYKIEALEGHDVWVNGQKISAAHLLHGDMIEFGEDGPMARFRLCGSAFPTRWPVEEIIGDAVAYSRTSRRPFGSRMSSALFESVRRILLETSLAFRVMVVAALILLTGLVTLQYRNNERTQHMIEAEALRLEAIATALSETRREALTAEDLATLRQQLDLQLRSNADRLVTLERRLGASARVISESRASVAFLQGAYGLREKKSGKLLRHFVDPDGSPVLTPFGQPMVDVDAPGPPIEFQFTGTGFLLEQQGLLATARHVALPWTSGDKLKAFEKGGFAPETLKLLAFFPGLVEPLEAGFLRASDDADLALLSVEGTAIQGRGLALSRGTPQIGDEVIVMGFPAGLRALLAQAGRGFFTELEKSGETDFWTIAMQLAEKDKIAPLASRGIVAQITPRAVVYDAETTTGGSGGPALNMNGEVVAVTSAILPDFGGANIGVPVEEVDRLLTIPAGQ
jgi:serine protease Do